MEIPRARAAVLLTHGASGRPAGHGMLSGEQKCALENKGECLACGP